MVPKGILSIGTHGQKDGQSPKSFQSLHTKNFAIYVLDDYAVHLMREVRRALYERGYILTVMGGGITGFIQANDTDLHRCFKALYRHEEMDLMLQMLEMDKNKTHHRNAKIWLKCFCLHDEMYQMILLTYSKKLFVTNALDGSEVRWSHTNCLR